MHLAYPLPWWLAVILAAGVAAAAFVEYRRPLAALSTAQRVALVALRVVTLSLLLRRPGHVGDGVSARPSPATLT